MYYLTVKQNGTDRPWQGLGGCDAPFWVTRDDLAKKWARKMAEAMHDGCVTELFRADGTPVKFDTSWLPFAPK